MDMKTLVALAAGFCMCTLAAGQDVKCEKYTLANGMTVILHEDHALPVASVNIWYRVGSQDEPPGRSGFAHLFEHLMFMGTKRVPGNEFDVLMESGGGANNASTDLHRTNYYSWGPSSLLPTLLWLDADRLEDMGLNMTKEKLDKQRDVVRNELRQVVENAPYGKAGEMLWQLMFPPGHPYRTGVIGTHEDLEAANVANVKDFFANFYVPSNASLVVAGDFDPAVIKPLVAGLFGSIPGGAPVPRKYDLSNPAPVTIDGVRRATAIDKVQLPKVQMNYVSPRAFQPGDAEMRLCAAVLAGGKSSRLYKRLVMDEQIAAEVSASQQAFPLVSIFSIDVYAKPEVDLGRIEQVVDEEIAKLTGKGVTSDEMEREKATIELGVLRSLQTIERKADALNEYEYYLGEPNSFKRDLDRYRNATAEDVQTWASRTLTPGSRAVIRVLPEEPERGDSARDHRPDNAPAGRFGVPMPTEVQAGGLKVLVWERHELPLVSVRLVCKPAGSVDRPGKQGLGSLMAQMLAEGAGDLDSVAFENAVQTLGADFNTGSDEETVDASMTMLGRNFEKSLGLFADAVRRPRLEQSDWDRVKALHLDDLKQSREIPTAVAAVVGNRLLFGDENPYGWPIDGSLASVESISREDVVAAHRALLSPANCTLLIAGDVTPDQARAAVEGHFGGWQGGPGGPGVRPSYSTPDSKGMRVVIVNRPGAVQTVIRFSMPGVVYADKNRVGLRLVNTLLGGSFTSRLNQNLRENHGYTYGARSSFNMGASAGSFTAAASVQAEVTGAALGEFLGELNRIRSGDISDAETVKARETLRNDTVRSYAGLAGLVGNAATLLESNLPLTTVTDDLTAMSSAAAAPLNELARASVPLDRSILVLVGDKALILEQIKDLGLPTPSEYDTDGNPVTGK